MSCSWHHWFICMAVLAHELHKGINVVWSFPCTSIRADQVPLGWHHLTCTWWALLKKPQAQNWTDLANKEEFSIRSCKTLQSSMPACFEQLDGATTANLHISFLLLTNTVPCFNIVSCALVDLLFSYSELFEQHPQIAGEPSDLLS